MDWSESIINAVEYIEANICEDISIKDIAKRACISQYYFQKIFASVCGITVGEYIRNRKLSLAGADVLSGKEKIIDIAVKYGYDSPDSFTRAFCRFHGNTPSAVRKYGAQLYCFAPFKTNILSKGRTDMNYKIVKKDAFSVTGYRKKFSYDNGPVEVPKFWKEFLEINKNKYIKGMYGINMDTEMKGEEFVYMIADDSSVVCSADDSLVTVTIPAFDWAIFECNGPSAQTMSEVNRYIFTHWLTENGKYDIAAGFNIEMYSDASEYPMGIMDENYHSEVWIPVKENK